MDKEKIDTIINEMGERTAWGITLDAIELSLAKRDAEHLIDLIDDALSDIEEFSRNQIPDPTDEVVEKP